MSSDETPHEPVPRDRREAVREKALQVQARQSRHRVLRRSALALGVLAAVAVVAVLVTWTVAGAMGKPQLSPSNVSGGGFTITDVNGAVSASADMSEPGAAASEGDATPAPSATPDATDRPVVDIQVYVDYLSPGAREWQLANAAQLTSWVREEAVTLSYHPISMLTAKSNGTKYSLRAAGAAACVATYSPDTFFAFHTDLLTQQPAIDSDGLSDKELANLAIASGASDPKRMRTCIEDQAFTSWAKAATEEAVAGIPGTDLTLTSTPMIIVNGQPYVGVLDDPAEFSQFVLTSASGAFYKSQNETATPTPTPTAAP